MILTVGKVNPGCGGGVAGQASDQCGLALPSTGVMFDASQTEAQPERGTCPRLTATETALPAPCALSPQVGMLHFPLQIENREVRIMHNMDPNIPLLAPRSYYEFLVLILAVSA